jgi:hypothetical protein
MKTTSVADPLHFGVDLDKCISLMGPDSSPEPDAYPDSGIFIIDLQDTDTKKNF